MSTNSKTVVTRFAPSPTGFMHIGGVRTALYAFAYAKAHNGKFILRIEDTDKEREVGGSISHIIESLKWLGIDWDEGPDIGGSHAPYIQSQRLSSYLKYAKILIDKGMAYADPYTEEEVETFRRQAKESKKPFLYRNHRPKNPPIWNGTQPLRFKVADIKPYEWNDLVRGDLKAGPEALDDFILIKSDGYPTYNFAHIIDDFEMGVTHIMRADEFIASTPKFLSLYDALEIERPHFATLPPIMGPDGKKKLGKRDGAKDVLEYEKEGYLPEAMVNFLAFIGWNPGNETEIINMDEFIKLFDIDKIHHSGGKFNEEKLDWINKEHLKLLSYEEQEEYAEKFIPNSLRKLKGYTNEVIHNIVPIIMERISKGKDIADMAVNGELTYFFGKPAFDRDSLFFKSSKIPEENKYQILSDYLANAISIIQDIPIKDFTKENIKEKLWPYAEEIGRGDILWPIRYALSGLDKSPDPFIIASILGKNETISRLNAAIQILRA
ncbi:MAG TPA: glutamate--tRNA ligase [Candidatus Paceibacterota bacterium]|nr:glutamate--tRNA ligase [Candidatus Paceibacterota bacterium]